MKWILCFFFLLFGPKSWAFQYEVQEKSLLQPSLVNAAALSRMFYESAGLQSVRGQSLIHAGMPFDFIYVSDHWDKMLLVKEGLKAPANILGKVIQDDKLGGQIFNFKFEERYYMLVATGFSKDELLTTLQELRPQRGSAKWSFLVPEAHAILCGPVIFATSALLPTKMHIQNAALLKAVGKCTLDAVQGARQSVVGVVEFFQKLKNDPEGLAVEMKKSSQELWYVVTHIGSEIKKTLSQFQSLSTEQLEAVACTMAGEALSKVAMGVLSVGGMVKAVPTLLLKIRSAAAKLVRLAEMQKRGIKVPDLNYASREILRCGS